MAGCGSTDEGRARCTEQGSDEASAEEAGDGIGTVEGCGCGDEASAEVVEWCSEEVEEWEEIELMVDSGASMHLVSRSTLTKREKQTLRTMRTPIRLQTANGIVWVTEEVDIYIQELKITVLL